MTTDQKAAFLLHRFPVLLDELDAAAPRAWGKMSAQQMTEHMSDSVRQGNGRDPKDCINPREVVEKLQAFLRSEKPFRENTPNALLGEEPLPCRWPSQQDAVSELREELKEFENVWDQDKEKIITNPFFGDLGYELWVALLYKHAVHHLRQFGVTG